jgi:hypothetical protein
MNFNEGVGPMLTLLRYMVNGFFIQYQAMVITAILVESDLPIFIIYPWMFLFGGFWLAIIFRVTDRLNRLTLLLAYVVLSLMMPLAILLGITMLGVGRGLVDWLDYAEFIYVLFHFHLAAGAVLLEIALVSRWLWDHHKRKKGSSRFQVGNRGPGEDQK